MSKTVSELAQELGVSKQYLNRILSRNNLGRKKGNKKVVSDIDEKTLISILKGNIGNQKTETKKIVSDITLSASKSRNIDSIGNNKSETSFRYLREQLEIKGKEVEGLQKLLDQSQQLLLNEQKKNQTLLETKSEWRDEKVRLENRLELYRSSLENANQKANENYYSSVYVKRLFLGTIVIASFLFLMVVVLLWVILA